MKFLPLFYITLAFSLLSCSSYEEKLKNAKQSLNQENVVAAITSATEAINKDSSRADAYNIRGVAYFTKGDMDKAEKDFTKAISLDSTSYKPFYNRGRIRYENKQIKTAIIDYNKAISLDGKQSDLYNNRGIAFFNDNEYEKAISDFSIALELDPDSYKALYNRANVHRKMNEFEAAAKDFEATIKIKPDYSEALYWLGITYFDLKKGEEGCDFLNKASKMGFEKATPELEKRCRMHNEHAHPLPIK